MDNTRGGYRVLIADDDANVHQSLNVYLRKEGYEVISAYDGEEAIDKAKSTHPDMIVLDIMIDLIIVRGFAL